MFNLTFLASPEAWLTAASIFLMRVGDMSLDTIRVILVVRGQKRAAWGLGFAQSVVYVAAISSALANLNNPLAVIGYAAGFATGNVLGMWVEGWMALGHTRLTIISTSLGAAVATALRERGFAVTQIPARGRDGRVEVLHCDVARRDRPAAEQVIQDADPNAFITAEEVRPLRRGFFQPRRASA